MVPTPKVAHVVARVMKTLSVVREIWLEIPFGIV